MLAKLLERKQTHFILWRPRYTEPKPTLFIGNFQEPNPVHFGNFKTVSLKQSKEFPDIWEIAATECSLDNNQVYYYWFKVRDADPSVSFQVVYHTDPIAYAVDRNTKAPTPLESNGVATDAPASVILFQDGKLVPSDPNGKQLASESNKYLQDLAPNNRIVIYELPTRWMKNVEVEGQGKHTGEIVGTGTFQDVLALLDRDKKAPNFPHQNVVNEDEHLIKLGVNVLELLPCQDSPQVLEWGYGTANYFSADFDLGRPDGKLQSTATYDLLTLIQVCHQKGLRFFSDIVMAFSVDHPYRHINFQDFLKSPKVFGGDAWRYCNPEPISSYDPIAGENSQSCSEFMPARRFMMTHISHWMSFYHIDGIRMDDVYDINNWDFVGEFTGYARSLWQERGGAGDRFIVIGEELSVPTELVKQNKVDALWNEKFKRILRKVLYGEHAEGGEGLDRNGQPSFEWSVRRLIDCRELGFSYGTQAVNYIGSHDIGGDRDGDKFFNQRFFDYLNRRYVDKDKHFKLAFVCLLTAVGIPMILAGDEFADQLDLPLDDHNKQIDPVNFKRLSDNWRKDIFDFVARLIHLRKTSDALAVNDTEFIYVDFDENKRVIVWQRGQGENLVIVVANFSDYGSPGGVNGEYIVPNWPFSTRAWQEVSQNHQPRTVASEKVGKEPIFPWEAKVYVLS